MWKKLRPLLSFQFLKHTGSRDNRTTNYVQLDLLESIRAKPKLKFRWVYDMGLCFTFGIVSGTIHHEMKRDHLKWSELIDSARHIIDANVICSPPEQNSSSSPLAESGKSMGFNNDQKSLQIQSKQSADPGCESRLQRIVKGLLSILRSMSYKPLIATKEKCLEYLKLKLTDEELKTILYYALLLLVPKDLAKVLKDEFNLNQVHRHISSQNADEKQNQIWIPFKAQVVIYQRKGSKEDCDVIILHQNVSILVSIDERGTIQHLNGVLPIVLTDNMELNISNIQLIVEHPPESLQQSSNAKSQP